MKSKKSFLMVAAVIVVLVILVIIGYQPNTDVPQETDPECSTDAEGNVYVPVGDDTTEATEPTELEVATTPVPFVPETTLPVTTVQVSENVTIHQVECDPNEVINPAQSAYPDDPEFLPEEKDAGPLINDEGYNFRNDKVITYTFTDNIYADNYTYEIEFGYITGKCNRFLYLNPQVVSDPEIPYYFQFTPVRIPGQSGGDIYVASDPADNDLHTNKSFYFFEGLDDGGSALYKAPNCPGVFWSAGIPLTGPIYINCNVYRYGGYQVALLQLTIVKNEDGTYSLANITDRDLLNDPDQKTLPEADIQNLIEMSAQVTENKNGEYFETTDNTRRVRNRENYRMELVDESSGFYFPFFQDYPSTEGAHQKKYLGMGLPIVAVSYRLSIGCPRIYYFLQTAPAMDGKEAIYKFIGQAYQPFTNIEFLRLRGYGKTG